MHLYSRTPAGTQPTPAPRPRKPSEARPFPDPSLPSSAMPTHMHIRVLSQPSAPGQDADDLADAQSIAVPGGIFGLDKVREPPLPALHNIPSRPHAARPVPLQPLPSSTQPYAALPCLPIFNIHTCSPSSLTYSLHAQHHSNTNNSLITIQNQM